MYRRVRGDRLLHLHFVLLAADGALSEVRVLRKGVVVEKFLRVAWRTGDEARAIRVGDMVMRMSEIDSR
jgi:hypothetical protein